MGKYYFENIDELKNIRKYFKIPIVIYNIVWYNSINKQRGGGKVLEKLKKQDELIDKMNKELTKISEKYWETKDSKYREESIKLAKETLKEISIGMKIRKGL